MDLDAPMVHNQPWRSPHAATSTPVSSGPRPVLRSVLRPVLRITHAERRAALPRSRGRAQRRARRASVGAGRGGGGGRPLRGGVGDRRLGRCAGERDGAPLQRQRRAARRRGSPGLHHRGRVQGHPRVAMAADGRFARVWTCPAGAQKLSRVYGRLFRSDGKASGQRFLLGTGTREQFEPDVARSPDGNLSPSGPNSTAASTRRPAIPPPTSWPGASKRTASR